MAVGVEIVVFGNGARLLRVSVHLANEAMNGFGVVEGEEKFRFGSRDS
jgi:hypothetical protein